MYATSIVKEKKIYIHRGKSLHNLLLRKCEVSFLCMQRSLWSFDCHANDFLCCLFPPSELDKIWKKDPSALWRKTVDQTRRHVDVGDENIMIVRNTVEGMWKYSVVGVKCRTGDVSVIHEHTGLKKPWIHDVHFYS